MYRIIIHPIYVSDGTQGIRANTIKGTLCQTPLHRKGLYTVRETMFSLSIDLLRLWARLCWAEEPDRQRVCQMCRYLISIRSES